jgi:hypothetical protein
MENFKKMNNDGGNDLFDYLNEAGVLTGPTLESWPTTLKNSGVVSLFTKNRPGTKLSGIALEDVLNFIGDTTEKGIRDYENFEFTMEVFEVDGAYTADIEYVGYDGVALMPFSADNGGYLINAAKTKANDGAFTLKVNAAAPLFWLMKLPN